MDIDSSLSTGQDIPTAVTSVPVEEIEDGEIFDPFVQDISSLSNSGIFCQGRRGHWAVYYTSPQSLIIMFFIRWILYNAREEGNIGLYIILVPNVFFFVGLRFNIDWLVHLVECQKVIVIYRRGNFVHFHCHIGDVYQFVGHCLIPLNPCFNALLR